MIATFIEEHCIVVELNICFEPVYKTVIVAETSLSDALSFVRAICLKMENIFILLVIKGLREPVIHFIEVKVKN